LIFGEKPKFDDALEKVSSLIRTEQGLLAVAELLEYFRSKDSRMLILFDGKSWQ
jgi:hypothetical protein